METLGGVQSTYRIVRCSLCRCDLSFYPSPEKAAEVWNTRKEVRP